MSRETCERSHVTVRECQQISLGKVGKGAHRSAVSGDLQPLPCEALSLCVSAVNARCIFLAWHSG